MIDPGLLEYASPKQREVVNSVLRHGDKDRAAAELGCTRRNVDLHLQNLKRSAAAKGFAPDAGLDQPSPEGFTADRFSKYTKGVGWVRYNRERRQSTDDVIAAMDSIAEQHRGLLAPVVPMELDRRDDLMALLPIGDHHMGLYCSMLETGSRWDLALGKQVLRAAIDRLVSVTPGCGVGVLAPLGDLYHMNDATFRTPASKHLLDVSGSFSEIVEAGVDCMLHGVRRMLERFTKVIVIVTEGNHDPETSVFLRLALKYALEQNERVEVRVDHQSMQYLRWHKNLLGFTHGHTAKGAVLGQLMATDRPQDWGETVHRYVHTGHIHSRTVDEFPGVVCESHRVLPPADKFGRTRWRSGRGMQSIVYHAEHGEIGRTSVTPDMLL